MKNTNEIVSSATLNGVRISPRKAKLAVDLIRGKQVERALDMLRFKPVKSCRIVLKILESAIANASEKGANVDDLWVTGGFANMGKTLKRFRPRAKGSASPLRKRCSRITLELGVK